MAEGRLLIVDDERIAVKNLEHVMRKEGYQVMSAYSGPAALELLRRHTFDVVLTDLRMERVDGMRILQECRTIDPDVEVVLITGFATLETAVDAMKQGAFFYVAKPFRLDEVRKVVAEAMDKIRLKRENRGLREQLAQYQDKVRIITRDSGMERLLETARQVAPTGCTVLITGESGVGKELFARYLHHASGRDRAPFLAVNCGALTEELLGNELFGHDKGAFTGATGDKPGLLEATQGGTLFLDEITEMPTSMQVKLLRVIQEKEVLRLGSTRPIKVDVRFIAATNRNVEELVKTGRFRQDLYYRLNVVALHIPPLSQRRGDIPLLIHYFLQKSAIAMRKSVSHIDSAVVDLLEGYPFPGNVRELENIIERSVAICAGDTIQVAHLPEFLRTGTFAKFQRQNGRLPTLEEQEKAYILWVLTETGGNQSQAAQMLGIDRVSLWRKLKRYDLESQPPFPEG